MGGSRTPTIRFRERAELLDFLLEVSAATSQTLDLDQLMANLAKIIAKVIPYELFAILLYSERLGALRIRYAIGHREEIVRNLLVALGEGITGAAAASREAILVPDVRQDPRYLSGLDAVRSELAAPMVARGKLVGVIDVQSTRVNAYTEYDRALLKLIASRVAVAIDNARLYRRVERQNRMLATLAHLARDFSILDLDQLLEHIAQAVKRIIDYDAFSILLVDENRCCLTSRFSLRYDQRVKLDRIPLGQGITGAAAVEREVIRADETLGDPRYAPSHPGIRSEVAVPLVVRDRVIGVMDLESERHAHFTDGHVRMLSLLAPQIAISIENARLYEEVARRQRQMEQDLEAARELQYALVWRQPPEIEGLDVAVGYRPARQITGDLCHFYPLDSGEAFIALGDVSGKGVAAALYGALVNGLLLSLAPRRRSPATLMKALNEALLERQVYGRYVTLITLRWLPSERQLVIANAGGMPPLLCREGQIMKPRVEGVPLGLIADAEHEEVVLHGQAGDLLLLYSDGLPDQTNERGEEYGRERLLDVLGRVWDQPAQAVINAVFADLDQFSGSEGPGDDQTIVALRLR